MSSVFEGKAGPLCARRIWRRAHSRCLDLDLRTDFPSFRRLRKKTNVKFKSTESIANVHEKVQTISDVSRQIRWPRWGDEFDYVANQRNCWEIARRRCTMKGRLPGVRVANRMSDEEHTVKSKWETTKEGLDLGDRRKYTDELFGCCDTFEARARTPVPKEHRVRG